MSPRKPCTIEDCSKPRHSQGLCNMHRQRLRNTGSVHKAKREPIYCSRCGSKGHHRSRCTILGKEHLDGLPEDMRPRYYPGEVKCNRCGETFQSECKRRFRRCKHCVHWVGEQGSSIAEAEVVL